jgi:small neutral amino acid transporter SnatA (MarC family)
MELINPLMSANRAIQTAIVWSARMNLVVQGILAEIVIVSAFFFVSLLCTHGIGKHKEKIIMSCT